MMKKHFFMASMLATAGGRPVAQFNTITAVNNRNIFARELTKIQTTASHFVQPGTFDDLVINNLMYLGEGTEEEFTAGTQLSEQAAADPQVAQKEVTEADNVVRPDFNENPNIAGENIEQDINLTTGQVNPDEEGDAEPPLAG